MNSKALNFFPQIFFEGKERVLFNPILRKRFKNRPEERVRLRWVEYLIHQTDIKKSRIGFEAPVEIRNNENFLRADIIIYDKKLKPKILVECKSTSVALTEETGKQAARYNTSIGASSICLTNGLADLWFKIDNGSVIESKQPIKQIHSFNDLQFNSKWWGERGFYSPEGHETFTTRMQETCRYLYGEFIDWPLRYLEFTAPFLPFSLSHYYKVASLDESSKLAITFIRTHDDKSLLTSVLNVNGMNIGFLVIDLEKLFKKSSNSATLYKSREQIRMDAHKHIPLFDEKFNPSIIENLPNFLIRLFD